jgi:hypothetical protein
MLGGSRVTSVTLDVSRNHPLQPDAPGADVDLRNVTAIDFVFTFNGSARFRSFKVI